MLVRPPVRSAVPAVIKPVQVPEPVRSQERVHKLKPERLLALQTVSLGAMAAGPTAVHAPARHHGVLAVTTVHVLTAVGLLVRKQLRLR